MKRKCLAVGIILLFIGTCIIPAIAQDAEKSQLTSRGNWLYVGGSGPGNYTTIQEAIDNASIGDTIFVYKGIYNSATITKSISLMGEKKEDTILTGTPVTRLILIKTDNIVIKGFTLKHEVTGGSGISLQHYKNITLTDLILINNSYGIFNYWSTNCLIENITFKNNEYGMESWSVENTTLSHCFFEGNEIAINHKGRSSIVIKDCYFTNNTCAINLNELSLPNYSEIIEGNTFFKNDYGIVTFDTEGAVISKNNFIENLHHVGLYRSSQILLVPFYIRCRQHWSGNYWDNWNSSLPCPLRGTWVLFVWPGLFYQFLQFPYIEFDWHPAQEPYDITGMT